MKAAAVAGSSAIARAKPRREAGGFSTLYKKELADHFHSARFKLVFALLILTSLASLYGALSSISDATFSSSEDLFLALYTKVELHKRGLVPLEQFTAMDYDNDILVRAVVRKVPCRLSYQAMRIQRTDLPVLTCAVCQLEGETRAVIGARPGKALVIRDDTGLLQGGITAESAAAFADYVTGKVPMGSNSRGSAAYRSHLCRVLTRRATLELGGQAQ